MGKLYICRVQLFLCLLLLIFLAGCADQQSHVVVYTSHDRALSEQILRQFQIRTGITVRAVYDTEANKTTGLINRLFAEASSPVADVFWNNEVGRTIQLAEAGVLASYASPAFGARSGRFNDPDFFWSGFAARARVLIVNTDLVDVADVPKSIHALADPKWKGRAAIANPHFGTTGTHFAALQALWGSKRTREWFDALFANEVQLLPGNAAVRDKVASGALAFGLTDTDDANGALEDGKPVRIIFPDQHNGLGALLIPNTVSLVKGAPRGEFARQAVDFLLSPMVENMLAEGRGAQYPLLPNSPSPKRLLPLSEVHWMSVEYQEIARQFEPMLENFREAWPR